MNIKKISYISNKLEDEIKAKHPEVIKGIQSVFDRIEKTNETLNIYINPEEKEYTKYIAIYAYYAGFIDGNIDALEKELQKVKAELAERINNNG